MLDYQQLARDIVDNGGATVDVLTGDAPTAGFAVSQPDGTEWTYRIPRTTRELGNLAYSYVVAHGRRLRDPGAHLGAWIHNGWVYFDVTHVVEDRAAAITLGQLNGQLAIYDLSTGEEITLTTEVK